MKRDQKVLPVTMVLEVFQVQLGHLDQMVPLVRKVNLALVVHLVLMEPEQVPELVVNLVLVALLDLLVHLVLMVSLVLKVNLVSLDKRAMLDLQAPKDCLDPMDQGVLLGWLD